MKPILVASIVGVAGLVVGFGAGLVTGRRSAPTAAIDAAGSRRTTPAAALIEKYLAQDKCMDRVSVVFESAANKPLMAEHYKETPSCLKRPKTIDDASCRDLTAGRTCIVRAAFEPSGWTDYCVRLVGSDMVVDWRCSMGWNPMPIKAFMAQMPTDRRLFRVVAVLSDYYNYAYSRAKGTAYSIRMTDMLGDSLHGYVEKTSPLGMSVYERLKDGREHRVMVELTYASQKSGDTSEIVRLVADGWSQIAEETK